MTESPQSFRVSIPNSGIKKRVPTTLPKTTIELIYRAAERFGDRSFIEENGTKISFAEFKAHCIQTAAGLKSLGFAPGDRAAIWAPNISEWIVAAFGIHFAGGQIVTLNTRYKGEEAAAILNDSGASTLFVIGDFLGTNYPDMLAGLALPHLQNIVTFRDEAQLGWTELQAKGKAWLQSHGADMIEQGALGIPGGAISDIMFTSGTTGRAKGVLTSHDQNVEAFMVFSELLGLDDTDRYLIINPFFHSFGFKAGLIACLCRGCTVLPEAIFDVDKILGRIDAEQVTVMPGPPTIFQSILAHPKRHEYSLASLTKCTTGAAVIPTELIIAMRDELKIETIITAYGLSESCGLSTMCRIGDDPETIAKTSGRAIPGVEVRCADPEGNTVACGEQGEILVRGFNVMRGYLDNPAATAESIDDEGWLHTGDLGRMDEEGNLTITDRLKDMYISGGFNCYPAEIENALLRHHDIVQCAVIGYPDERMGEVGWAFLVLREGIKEPSETYLAYAKNTMANYKAPRKVVICDSLPMNASGKVLKPTLRQWALEGKF